MTGRFPSNLAGLLRQYFTRARKTVRLDADCKAYERRLHSHAIVVSFEAFVSILLVTRKPCTFLRLQRDRGRLRWLCQLALVLVLAVSLRGFVQAGLHVGTCGS